MADWYSARDGNGFRIRHNMESVGTPDTVNIRSQVRMRGWVESGGASSIARGTGNGVLDGTTRATLGDATRTVPLNGSLLLYDVTVWINHNPSTGDKTVVGSTTYGTVNSGTPWGITRRTVSGSLPLPHINVAPPTDAWIRLMADAYLVTQDGNVGYFDGDTAGATWSGTPHQSTSVRPNLNDTPLYNAYEDDNRILSVEAGETAEFIIDTGYYAREVFQPIPSDVYPTPPGTYYVSDSTHLPIVAQQWLDFGGRVEADVTDRGQLIIRITAPAEDIPGTSGPYYLASSDGATRYAELKVNGIGIVSKPVELKLPTGADHERVLTEIAQSVEMPWIVTRRDAYTAANRMALKASAAAPTLSFTASFKEIDALGITAGSVIRFKDGLYRVISCTMNKGGVSVQLDPWTTIGDFDDVWEGTTIGDFDAQWAGRYIRDFNQKPLKRD